MNINVAGETYDSLVNGPGMRYVIFFQMCNHHCDGCHNQHTWSNQGTYISVEEIIEHISYSPFISGVTISGGEPFLQLEELYNLCVEIKKNYKNLNILVYTGYTLQELRENAKINGYIDLILDNIDYLIDGKYEKNNPTSKLYIGSDNQKIYIKKNNKFINFNLY